MKRFMVVLFVLVMVLGMSVSAFANTHTRETGLTASATNITTGQTVTFTAVTLKHGSSYASPTWYYVTTNEDGEVVRQVISAQTDNDITTTSFENDYYTSTRAINFANAGTYVIEYEIVMAAGKGKSNVQFIARDSVTITVVAPVVAQPQIVSYEIINVTKGTAILNPQGNITGYNATGTLLAVYDNGNRVLVNNNFAFTLTRLHDNLQTPETYNGLPVALIGPVN